MCHDQAVSTNTGAWGRHLIHRRSLAGTSLCGSPLQSPRQPYSCRLSTGCSRSRLYRSVTFLIILSFLKGCINTDPSYNVLCNILCYIYFPTNNIMLLYDVYITFYFYAPEGGHIVIALSVFPSHFCV